MWNVLPCWEVFSPLRLPLFNILRLIPLGDPVVQAGEVLVQNVLLYTESQGIYTAVFLPSRPSTPNGTTILASLCTLPTVPVYER